MSSSIKDVHVKIFQFIIILIGSFKFVSRRRSLPHPNPTLLPFEKAMLQPCFQDLSFYHPLEQARRDPGWVCSHTTLTIENIRKGTSVIKQFVCIQLYQFKSIVLWLPLPMILFRLKFQIVSIPKFIWRLSKSASRFNSFTPFDFPLDFYFQWSMPWIL